MSIHFNDPNTNPKSLPDAVKIAKHFKSGEEQAKHERLIRQGLAQLGMDKTPTISDIERLMTEALGKIEDIRRGAVMIADAHIAEGKLLDRPVLAREINSQFLDAFVGYNKEALLIILTTILCQNTVREVG